MSISGNSSCHSQCHRKPPPEVPAAQGFSQNTITESQSLLLSPPPLTSSPAARVPMEMAMNPCCSPHCSHGHKSNHRKSPPEDLAVQNLTTKFVENSQPTIPALPPSLPCPTEIDTEAIVEAQIVTTDDEASAI